MRAFLARYHTAIGFGIGMLGVAVAISLAVNSSQQSTQETSRRIVQANMETAGRVHQVNAAARNVADAFIRQCELQNRQALAARAKQTANQQALIMGVVGRADPAVVLHVAAFLQQQAALLHPTQNCSPSALGVLALLQPTVTASGGVVPTPPASKPPGPVTGPPTTTCTGPDQGKHKDQRCKHHP
jgi:hypothetical protein